MFKNQILTNLKPTSNPSNDPRFYSKSFQISTDETNNFENIMNKMQIEDKTSCGNISRSDEDLAFDNVVEMFREDDRDEIKKFFEWIGCYKQKEHDSIISKLLKWLPKLSKELEALEDLPSSSVWKKSVIWDIYKMIPDVELEYFLYKKEREND